jgi:hydrogenase expression/formation protein HypE
MFVANEGKLIAAVAANRAESVVEKMRVNPLGRDARIIGEVTFDNPGMVLMKTEIGGTRIIDTLFGEQLPRIC